MLLRKLDKIFNKIADYILIIVVIILVFLFLKEFWYPYAAGQYQLGVDYYQQHK